METSYNIVKLIIEIIPKNSIEYKYITPELTKLKDKDIKPNNESYKELINLLFFHLGSTDKAWKKQIIQTLSHFNRSKHGS